MEEEGRRIDWVQEHERRLLLSARHASCSFYVPLLTPIVVVFQSDDIAPVSEPEQGDGVSQYSITIQSSSTNFSESFPRQQSSFRLYGADSTVAGFQGKELPLIACEEVLTVVVRDGEKDKVLATFDYNHLDPSNAPRDVCLDNVDKSGESTPFHRSGGTQEHNGAAVATAADEEDELQDSDGDVVITKSSSTAVPPRAPFRIHPPTPTPTPSPGRTKREANLLDSFMPQFKAHIKSEGSSAKPSDKKLADLPLRMRRTTEQRLIEIRQQLTVSVKRRLPHSDAARH